MNNRRHLLEGQIEQIRAEVDKMNLENSVLQKYYETKKSELGIEEEDKKKGAKGAQRMKKNIATTVTVDQKYDIASSVLEDLHGELEKNKKNYEKMIDTLRAVLEETEIRITELKRDAYEFKRDVVVGAENSRTGKIMAERVTRYLEEKIKSKDSIIEKMRLKNSTLKNQINKVEKQLNQKEEIGDVLHYIDFHQLQIENKQYLAKIEERNEELLTVKLSTSKTLRALNDLKRQLTEKMTDHEWLEGEINNKNQLLDKLKSEVDKVGKDVTVEARTKTKLRQQIEEAAEMPNVEDYILQKKDMYQLQSTLKNWQKKIDILEMAAKKSKSNATTLKLKNERAQTS